MTEFPEAPHALESSQVEWEAGQGWQRCRIAHRAGQWCHRLGLPSWAGGRAASVPVSCACQRKEGVISPSPSQPQPGPSSHSPGDVARMQNRTGSGTGTGLKVKGSEATRWIPTTLPESLNLSVLIGKMGVIILARQGYCKD